MKNSKVVNYSDAQVQMLVDGYKPNEPNPPQLAALAAEIGKPEKSVQSKLSSLGLYQKDAPVKAAGEKKITKSVKCAEIGVLAGMPAVEVEALEKTTNAVLDRLLLALTNDVTES